MVRGEKVQGEAVRLRVVRVTLDWNHVAPSRLCIDMCMEVRK